MEKQVKKISKLVKDQKEQTKILNEVNERLKSKGIYWPNEY